MTNKTQNFLVFTCIFGFSVLTIRLLNPYHVFAYAMANQQYELQIGNITNRSKQAGLPKQPEQNDDTTSGNNYIIRKQSTPLSISIDTSILDFGPLSPANPIIRQSTVSINTQNQYGLYIFEDHPLQTDTKAQIPDTSCDNGSCDIDTPATWVSNLTYGFGYHCNCAQFSDDSSFSPLPSLQNKNNKVHLQTAGKTPTVIQYKLNANATQASGTYYNQITYFAVPAY